MSHSNKPLLTALGLVGIALAVCLAALPEKKPPKKETAVGNLPVLWESLPENAKRYRISRHSPTPVENPQTPAPETPQPTVPSTPAPMPSEAPSPTPVELPQVSPQPVPEPQPREPRSTLDILLLCGQSAQLPGSAVTGAMGVLSLDFTAGTARLLRLDPQLAVTTPEGAKTLSEVYDPQAPDRLQQHLAQGLGLETDHYASLDFSAIAPGVDALGGAEVSLLESEAAAMGDGYAPGKTLLDGPGAAAYLQLSDADCGTSRALRERVLLRACLKQLREAKLSTLSQLYELLSPWAQTDLHKGELLRLMLKAPQLLEMHLELYSLQASDMDSAAHAARDFLYSSRKN